MNMEKEMYKEFNNEIARLKAIKWQSYAKTIKEVGVSYLGSVAQSVKMLHSFQHSVSTYCIYLASADLSGYNVCPNSTYCKENCLQGSGRNLINKRANLNTIENSRIIKTRLFFANKEVFMRLMLHEIERERAKAEKIGNEFSIRLNATSDINPTAFVLDGKNILEIYPDITFYDYTKVPNRFNLLEQYKNYDLTWSIDGSGDNLKLGLDYLAKGGRVAVVFGNGLPKKWYGYDVIDGDLYDFRYKDGNVIVGLKFKKTANNYKDGKFVLPNVDFIVTDNEHCEW